MTESKKTFTARRMRELCFSLFFDAVFLMAIIFFGWFLIGESTHYELYATGYQDWMYHAFRIASLERFGLTSWDFVWSNGMNYWKVYQYIPHFITLAVKNIFDISVTKAMIYTTVGVYIASLAQAFIFLRLLKVKRLAALLAISIGLSVPSIWDTMRDFSIFFPMLFFPSFLYAWAKEINAPKHHFFLPAYAAFLWLVHPIAGITASALWLWTWTPSRAREKGTRFLLNMSAFLIPLSAFLVPYVAKGYSFTNPNLSSTQFFRITLSADYLGFGLLTSICLILSWLAVLASPHVLTRWSKLLLLFITLFVATILLGREGYLPHFILQLQLSRAVPLLSLLSVFTFGGILQVLKNVRSRFFQGIMISTLAIFVVQAIDVATIQTIVATNSVREPVSEFLQTIATPTGSIYTENVSEASYFSPVGTRFVTSYNTHLEPHPLSQRFGLLLKNDLSYTGITKQQTDRIADYSQVLGVEYLFMPRFSPAVRNLTATASGQITPPFVESTTIDYNGYTVLRSTQEIHSAYFVANDTQLPQEELYKPTLQATSWQPWDKQITELAGLIRSQSMTPAGVEFHQPNGFTVDLSQKPENTRGVLVLLSYDDNWQTDANVRISPTATRFIYLELPSEGAPEKVTFTHTWPKWHWPLQILGLTGWIVALSIDILNKYVPKIVKKIRYAKSK